MPLKIETLFCDAACERDILSREELDACVERAGERGHIHAEALRAGFATAAQLRRVYRRIYADLDARHAKHKAIGASCRSCGERASVRFGRAYRSFPCPICLETIELGRAGGAPRKADGEPIVETSELTALARAVAGGEPAPPAPGELPREVAGLRVVELLADHDMGAVYKVDDAGTPRVVRVLDRGARVVDIEGLLAQYKRLSRLDHPNIRALRKVLRTKSQVFLVSDFLPGHNLEQLRLRSGGRLRPQLVLKVAYQVARALEEAHRQQVVHGGLTPVRILLSADKQVVVIDFGLGHSDEAIADYVLTGELEGHPGFMSPERCLGRGPADARSDLFSLGMVMHYCLAGALPFGEDRPSAVYAQAHGQVPSIGRAVAGLDAPIVQLVSRLVARDPEQRYPDAGTLLRDLGYIISGQAPRFVPADQLSPARLARVQRIQDARAKGTGVRVPLTELLDRQDLASSASVHAVEVQAEERYGCERCGIGVDLAAALASSLRCARCSQPLRVHPELLLETHGEWLIAHPSARLLEEDSLIDLADRHLRAAVALGRRKLVVDLDLAPQASAMACAWLVPLAGMAEEQSGRVVLLFAAERPYQQFSALGFDRWVEAHASRARFYRRELGGEVPRDATHERSGPQPVAAGATDAPVAFEGPFFEAYEAAEYPQALSILYEHYDEEHAFSPRWSYYQAACLWRLGQFDESLADLALVLEADPSHAEARYLRGLVYQARGSIPEALDEYAAVVELEPGHVKARCNRGTLLQVTGDLEAAATEFAASLEVNPRHVRSLVGLGTVSLERGELELAEDLLHQARAIDAQFAWAYFALARLAMRQDRPREALAHLRQAVRKNPALLARADGEPDFAPLRTTPATRSHYQSLRAH